MITPFVLIVSFLIASYFNGPFVSKRNAAIVYEQLYKHYTVKHEAIHTIMPYFGFVPNNDLSEVRIERNSIAVFSLWTIEGIGKVRRGTNLHKYLEYLYNQ